VISFSRRERDRGPIAHCVFCIGGEPWRRRIVSGRGPGAAPGRLLERIDDMPSRIATAAALLAAALALTACANTVRGVGKDVKDTGQAIEDVARG
jgi:predicted small secreted protein